MELSDEEDTSAISGEDKEIEMSFTQNKSHFLFGFPHRVFTRKSETRFDSGKQPFLPKSLCSLSRKNPTNPPWKTIYKCGFVSAKIQTQKGVRREKEETQQEEK